MTEINKDMTIGDILDAERDTAPFFLELLGLPGFARRNSRAGLYGSRC